MVAPHQAPVDDEPLTAHGIPRWLALQQDVLEFVLAHIAAGRRRVGVVVHEDRHAQAVGHFGKVRHAEVDGDHVHG